MRFALALAVSLTATALIAQSRTYEIRKDPKNLVEFHAEDTYDTFDGKTNSVSGTIVADAAKATAAKVDVSIDLASLDTGISLRNHEMRERYLQTPRFPNATFKSASIAIYPNGQLVGPPNRQLDAARNAVVDIAFTLHGVTKRMTLPARVVVLPDNRIHITSQFNVHMPDFDIHVPKNILVTVDDMIPVRLDLWAVAK